jgi:hypothetical protein
MVIFRKIGFVDFPREKSMPKLFAAVLLVLPLLCHAEVYKWVDAKGVVHYSDNKFEAQNAQVAELKTSGAPAPAAAPAGPTWQQRDAEFRRRQQDRLVASAPKPAHATPQPVNPKRPYYSNEIATDASRCELARDIISGAAKPVERPPDQQPRPRSGQ